MTINNGKAYQYLNKLGSLSETGRLGLAIAKNRRRLEEELKEYIQERDNLIYEYGEQNENGSYVVAQEEVDEFFGRLREFDEMEFEFLPQTVDEETFCSGGLTSEDMYSLDWMLKPELEE